jgi:ATP diphosphatase
MTAPPKPPYSIDSLIAVMAALRTPVTGCPWDLAQTFATIAPYTIEEAYEVADAIERGDRIDLKEELGDLLLQAVYHARLAEEEGSFAFADVVAGVVEKMIRRHPHVFGDAEARSAGAAEDFWEKAKADERALKARLRAADARSAGAARPTGTLADVPRGLTALTRAVKLQDKAARVGFDWPSLGPVFDKMREELGEFEDVVRGSGALTGRLDAQARGRVTDEFGDLLFVLANVARHLDIDPEAAVRRTNEKFVRRFAAIEAELARRGRTPSESTLEEMDAIWDSVRFAERARPAND